MTRLHGPWVDRELGSGPRRRDKKDELMIAAKSKQCACDLCGKHGQRGLPENAMWCRVSDDGTVGHSRSYIVARPVVL